MTPHASVHVFADYLPENRPAAAPGPFAAALGLDPGRWPRDERCGGCAAWLNAREVAGTRTRAAADGRLVDEVLCGACAAGACAPATRAVRAG